MPDGIKTRTLSWHSLSGLRDPAKMILFSIFLLPMMEICSPVLACKEKLRFRSKLLPIDGR